MLDVTIKFGGGMREDGPFGVLVGVDFDLHDEESVANAIATAGQETDKAA